MADNFQSKDTRQSTTGTTIKFRSTDSSGVHVPHVVARPEWLYAVVDLSTDSTTISSTPALIGQIWVNTVLSAHACPIMDGATTVWSLPASAPVTTTKATAFDHLVGTRFETSLIIDPNDSATGVIVVQWRAL